MLFLRAQRVCSTSPTALATPGSGTVFCVVICATWFSAARSCTNHPYLPTCKAKANEQGKWLRNQDSLHVLYAS